MNDKIKDILQQWFFSLWSFIMVLYYGPLLCLSKCLSNGHYFFVLYYGPLLSSFIIVLYYRPYRPLLWSFIMVPYYGPLLSSFIIVLYYRPSLPNIVNLHTA